jgi:hypothetical protein
MNKKYENNCFAFGMLYLLIFFGILVAVII